MKLSQPLIYFVFLLLIINCSKSYGQNSIMSKFYFPGQLGLSFPHVDDQKLNLKKGFMLTTALEFRPVDGNALFIRFNYDAITNHYQEVYLNSPTNVNTGKLSSSIFSLGLGYRHKAGIFKLFGLLQPGLGINNYDKVNFNTETITVEQVSRRHLSFKITAGAEYYLAEHFALTIEPSYFYLSPRGNYRLLNPQSLNLSLGFTTTLF
ncbi:outer membrane beta-barrel protein [Mucilaginibacter sp.]|uniref:outer membrane beta-barrel protein n=1 Tax=Mucilaginibacter sp. TaxID=1882438 RepID=UPI0025DE7A89|nr:outer membrane beta-barrel protein [Mucilaginibacter sp.]